MLKKLTCWHLYQTKIETFLLWWKSLRLVTRNRDSALVRYL